MRKISDKKANEIYDSVLFRHCYPYCVTLDLEKKTIAFRNRKYYFLHSYPADDDYFWFQLEPDNFERLNTYLSSTDGILKQTFGKRFLDYFLYDDGNPPMVKKYRARYRRILDKIIDIAEKADISDRLKQGCGGFDFGKLSDGEYHKINVNEKTENVYEMAKEEYRFYVNLPYINR